jgi:hypothetical protein
LAELNLDRDRAPAALDRIRPTASSITLDRGAIARFGSAMREAIATGEVPFRKAYIQSVVDPY